MVFNLQELGSELLAKKKIVSKFRFSVDEKHTAKLSLAVPLYTMINNSIGSISTA